MTRPRWRKIISDLWGNRLRSLLVIASITVGLFALGVIATIYAVMSEDMSEGYAATNPANIQLRGGPFDQDVVDYVSRITGVGQVEGALEFSLRLATQPGQWIQLDLHALSDLDDRQLNQLALVGGDWPPGERQIAFERYKFSNTRATVGETVELEMPSGKTRQLELVGVVSEQTLGAFASGPGFFLASARGYVTPATAEWLGQLPPGLYNTLYLTISGDRGDQALIADVAERVRADLERNGYPIFVTRTRSAFDHPNRVFVDALVGVLVLLGLFTVFLSGFLITNTLQALMKQQVQQIGIMKSLGGRRRQIIAIYIALILIFGVLAALFSIPLAARVAFQQVSDLAGEVNFVFRGPRLVPWAIAIQAALAILAPLVAALFPILQGARISVQEALSGFRQSKPPREGTLSRWLTSSRRLPRPIIISIRNTFRQKGRMLLTMLTLSLGGALFIGAFNVQVSMNQYVERVGQYFRGDVNLTLARPYRIARVEEALAGLPGITHIEGWAAASGELVRDDDAISENIDILAPPSSSQLVEPILIQGRWIEPGDINVVTLNERFMTRFPDLRVGDTLRIKINGRTVPWTVVGFYQLVGNSAGFIAYTSYESVAGLLGQSNQANTFRIVSTQTGLSEAQQRDLGQTIEDRLRQNGIRIAELQAGEEISTTASDGFAILTAFLLFLAGLTALVGSIGLAGTMSMNVLERTREIGVMRSIGATDAILIRMIISEGLLIGLLSWLFGALLAFPISKALSDAITLAIFGSTSTFGATPTGFLVWLVAVIVLSILASVLPARSAARLTIREVLAYE